MDENDRLNPQKNQAYFQTLSRSQQISFTRRIRFEYEVNFIFLQLQVDYYHTAFTVKLRPVKLLFVIFGRLSYSFFVILMVSGNGRLSYFLLKTDIYFIKLVQNEIIFYGSSLK